MEDVELVPAVGEAPVLAIAAIAEYIKLTDLYSGDFTSPLPDVWSSPQRLEGL